MDGILARVASLEKKTHPDYVKKVLEISCNVALQRLDEFVKVSKYTLQCVGNNCSEKCNATIVRNALESKKQRNEVKDLVSKLEKRLETQNEGMANMEACLKQMEELEARLVETIRQDQEDTVARLVELEKSFQNLTTVAADIEEGLEENASHFQAKVTADIEAALGTKAATILSKVTADTAAALDLKASMILEKVTADMAAGLEEKASLILDKVTADLAADPGAKSNVARLVELEKSSKNLTTVAADIEEGLGEIASHFQAKVTADIEAGLEAKAATILSKVTADTAAGLDLKASMILDKVTADTAAGLDLKASMILDKVTADMAAGLEVKASLILGKVTADMAADLGAKSKEMPGEDQAANNAQRVANRGLPLVDLLSSPPRCIAAFAPSVVAQSVYVAVLGGEGRTELEQSQDAAIARGIDVGPHPQASRIRGGRNGQGPLPGRVQGQYIPRLTSAGRASSVHPPLSQVDSVLSWLSGPSGPTIAEHGEPVTGQGDNSSCSPGGRSHAQATADIKHAQQMAFGREVLRRSREEHRGRASSVHEMIRAAQGDAYVRSVSARRSASHQPDQLLPLNVRHPRQWVLPVRD